MDGLVIFSMADDDPLMEAAVARGLSTVVMDQPEPAALARRDRGALWIGIVTAPRQRWPPSASCAGAPPDRRHHLLLARGQERGRWRSREARRHLRGHAGAPGGLPPRRYRRRSRLGRGAGGGRDDQFVTRARGRPPPVGPAPASRRSVSVRPAGGGRDAGAPPARAPRPRTVGGRLRRRRHGGPLGLTTIRQPHRGKGELAVRLLLELMTAGR